MIKLVMVLHCHQPVGNFDNVFEMAVKRCYRPVLELLDTHPLIKSGIHISGPLLEWMEKNTPECLDMLSSMVERDQIEMLSGGFFEPLLASIPLSDAKGQIQMMQDYLKERFNTKPTGFWLTERVWDPSIPLAVENSGLKYTVVDDTHMFYSGLKPNEIYGHYITEKEGRKLRIMATPMIMRYLIPFRPVEDVISHIRTQESLGRDVALYGDDIEKFGLWPGTYEWVLEKGWLNNFFRALEENQEWLKTELPGDYISSRPSKGRIYLPQASYEEMTEWALPWEQTLRLEDIVQKLKNENLWDEYRPFVRGGIWDNFLVKYDESNRMHKKMIFLSGLAMNNLRARDYIWRAQCNCAYWHGVFGGLYLGHLRRAIQENLVRAQACVMGSITEKKQFLQTDIDKDGHDEILIFNRDLGIGIAPASGGGIFDISFFPLSYNLSDVLTRRPEAYHNSIDSETVRDQPDNEGIASIHDLSSSELKDIKSLLVYDDYTKISLLDHFMDSNTDIHSFSGNTHHEIFDFIKTEYSVNRIAENDNGAVVEMSKSTSVNGLKLYVRKAIHLADNSTVTANLLFENTGEEKLSALYGCEFNLNMYSDQDPERYYYIPESGKRREISETGEEHNLKGFELINISDHLKVSFCFSRPLSVWFYPLMTISKSEKGFEHTYQGSTLLFNNHLELKEGEKEEFRVEMRLSMV